MGLEGHRIVVMGGSSGVGKAAAAALGAEGAQVVVTGRDPERLRAAARELGPDARGEVVDATSRPALDAFFAGLDRLDHLVLCVSGREGGGPFRQLELEGVRRGFDAKFWAQVQAAQACLGTLRADGSITFVTAASARTPLPGTSGLAAINGALEAMVPTLALELKPARVNAVSPGVIETPWWDALPAEQREAAFSQMAAAAPVGRIGRPADVADAIRFLVANDFMTGTIIECDGGIRIR